MIRLIEFLAMLIVIPISSAQIENTYYKTIPNKSFSNAGISYIPIGEGFRNPNSAWGSIGITNDGLVYTIACDHITDAALYEYDTKTDKLSFGGSLKVLLHNRFHAQRQPKVHTPLLQYQKNGLVYFGTDAGDESEGALYGHFDEGYAGGHLLTLDTKTKEVRNLGLANRFGGLKSLVLDAKNGALYFTVSPNCNLYRYLIDKDELSNLGRINGSSVVRSLFMDKWNNVYGTTETGSLVRYNVNKDSMEYLDAAPFGAPNTGSSQVVYGADMSYVIGFNAYSGQLSKYTADSAGSGKVEELGLLFTEKKVMCRNLNIVGNKLVALCTSVEEVPLKERFRFLTVFDIKEKKEVKRIEIDSHIHQAYGHPVMDKKGNIYICGFWDASDYDLPADVKSRVFLIKIPAKVL
jgi:sugar lactone lactonase YvrE